MNSTTFSDMSKSCAYCEKALSVADIDLMSSWLLELTRYEAQYFEMFCRKCFDTKYPEYLKTKWPLKEIKEWGRLFEVSEATIWKNAGFDAGHAYHWIELLLEDNFLVDIEVAKDWKQVGFTSENYQDWREWSTDPKEISTALKLNGETIDNVPAPELGFRALGFNLSQAIQLSEADFYTDATGCGSEGCINNWITGGLNVDELIVLKLQVTEKNDVFEEKHRECRENIKDWKSNFGTHLPKVLNALREAGLPITNDNLLRYWGLSKAQILKAIDMGTDVEFASNLVRGGISASKVKIVEHLMAKGIEEDSAIELTKRGFSIVTLEKIDKNGYSTDDLVSVVKKLKTLNADAVAPWFLVDIGSSKYAWANRIADWHQYGFTAETAAEWYREEFSAKDANAWVKAGAKTPAVAKRRAAAGITPKAFS